MRTRWASWVATGVLPSVALAMVFAGCVKKAPSEMSPTTRVSSLLFYRWSGTSPGSGFINTTLFAIEVDLGSGRFRRIRGTANAPQPMLPWEREAIADLLQREGWQPLSLPRSKHLATLVSTWVETAPPEEYVQHKGLGHEDGYVEQMVVEADGRRFAVGVDPRGGYRPDDPLLPPPEWRALLAFLDAL